MNLEKNEPLLEGEYDDQLIHALETPMVDTELMHPLREYLADVEVKVIRIVYGCNCILLLLASVIGAGIYATAADAELQTILLSLGAVLTGTAYGVLLLFTLAGEKWRYMQFNAMLILAGGLTMLLGAIAAMVQDIAPLQVTSNLFVATMAILACSFIEGKLLSKGKLGLIVGLVSLVVWLIGLYAIYEDADWLSAFVIAVVVICVDFYYVWAIDSQRQYHLGQKTYAVAHFFTDPFIKPIRALGSRCRRQSNPEEEEEK